MLKVQELLAKYKLSMNEINESSEELGVIELKTAVTFRQGKWKAELADLIAENFGCIIFFKTNRSHTIVFLGKEDKAKICEIMLTYAIDSIKSRCRQLAYEYRKHGYSTRGLESDYALGFIDGLREQFEKQKEKNKEWGLVLAREKDVQEAYDKMTFRKTINTSGSFNGFGDEYFIGKQDGKDFGINRIDKGKEKEQLKLNI